MLTAARIGRAGVMAILWFCPAAARAEEDQSGLHLAAVGGLGVAFGAAGVHAQLRWNHVAMFGGTGLLAKDLNSSFRPIWAFGVRGYLRPGSGPFLSANGLTGSSEQRRTSDRTSPLYVAEDNAFTVTAGWRFRFPLRVVLDVGAGGGIYWTNRSGQAPRRGIPDLALALGFEL